MITLDVFKQDAFKATELTAFVNKKPTIPSMLRDMNLFAVKPIRTSTFWVELKNGKIALVPTSERGAPVWQNEKQKREAVPLSTVRLKKGDRITATELQDIRAEGEADILKEVQTEVNMRLDQSLGDIDLTEENLMLGAIQGTIVDADGSTVITNLYTEFGVAQPTELDFDLDNATPASGALKKVCNQVVRGMTRAGGNAMTPQTSITAFVGDAFWDDLVAHPEVQGAYNNWLNAQSMSNTIAVFSPFRWGGIDWINYRGTDDASTVTIGTDKAKFFPVNARGLFEVAYSPSESMAFVNTRGQARYAMIIPDPTVRQEYADVEAASYLLPYCTRPETLFRGKRT